ncbi:MAG: hypothetical protein JWN66_10, partial [Sphingomonas bacterium]|uniref:PilZ domain-containing protein n=1 Tax=Sphingomonas bacterium TaxID=1895847 RepID=UPI002608905B
ALAGDAPHPADRRDSRRYSFRSASFKVRASTRDCDIRLKDLSCTGASGLMCEPVGIGEHVVVEFDAKHQVEAEVCWVRRFLVGLRFTNQLRPGFVERIRERDGSHGLAPLEWPGAASA